MDGVEEDPKGWGGGPKKRWMGWRTQKGIDKNQKTTSTSNQK